MKDPKKQPRKILVPSASLESEKEAKLKEQADILRN